MNIFVRKNEMISDLSVDLKAANHLQHKGVEILLLVKDVKMAYRFLCLFIIQAFCLPINWVIAQNSFPDTVVSPASLQYGDAGFLGRLINGENYRKEWSAPVSMPVFHLKEMGFTIEKLGGGMQTKSLHLVDKNKRDWVLRTVDKNAEGALPKGLRIPLVINFVQDMISAAHPYAPLVVDYLARAAHIIAPKPKLYFVPADETLGPYKTIFANTVCYLERRGPTPDNSDTKNTGNLMEKIIEENDHLVLQEMVLQARLLDMLVADWDRHADQWRWGVVDSAKAKYYYAIPRDRDQAFFMTDGLLPKFIKIFAMKHINGFKNESKGLKNLNFKSWQFDKTFLNELDAGMWKKNIKIFQSRLTDKVIEEAVKKMPEAIYAIDGAMLAEKLKSRRNSLLKNAMKYYDFISGTVTVFGTEQNEIFEISGHQQITVSVYRAENKQPAQIIYERKFNRDETAQVYLEGFGGNDQFLIKNGASSKIKIKISGGQGKDLYNLNGDVKVMVYDAVAEGNAIEGRSNARFYFN